MSNTVAGVVERDGRHPGATTRVIGPEPSSRQRATTGSKVPKLTSSVPSPAVHSEPVLPFWASRRRSSAPDRQVVLLEPAVRVAAVEHATLLGDGDVDAGLLFDDLPPRRTGGQVDAPEAESARRDDRAIAERSEVAEGVRRQR